MRANDASGSHAIRLDGVIEVQADIAQSGRLDGGERLGHAVDEGLDANHSGLRPCGRLGDHVFAAAKADLELNFFHRHGEQCPERGGRGMADINRETRQ